MATPTGKYIFDLSRRHHFDRKCPYCNEDCSRTALVDLVYTFDVCVCGEAAYSHLIEQPLHRKCFEKSVIDREGATR